MPFLLPAAATAMAAAAPAAAASTAAATAGATLTSIATNIAMNVAISAVMSALQPQVGAAGRTSEWTLSPDGPIPFAAGRIGVAGAVVHKATFGPDLMYNGIPAVLSGAGPIDGYETFKADEEFVAFDGNGKAVTSQYANELWYRKTMGNQPDVAVTSPPGLKNNATLPGWGAQHKLSGKAAYMVVMGENSKGTAFTTGEIKPLITLRGLKGWDPRLDSTWPGGEGPCRLDNPATWVYLRRPGLWGLKWSLGLWEGPTLKGAPAHGSATDYQVGGIGAKLSGIDVAAFVNLENICDANDWTVSAYPTTDDDKFAVLESFLQAAGATFAMRAGKISCIQRAAPRTSIVTIGAGDTAGPLEIDTAASRIDRINTIRPRILSEAHRWQMTAIAEVSAEAYREQDGAVRPRGIDYTYVSNATQGAQLAALQIANTREGIAGVVPLKPHLQKIKPGDAFTITEPGFVLNGLKCLCLSTDFDPTTKIVAVSFVSETDAKYPFALGQSQEPPEPAVLEPVDPRYVSPPGAGEWEIVVRPPSTSGGQVPGFDLTGSVDNATATAVLVEWGSTDEGPWTQAYLGPPTVEQIPITGVQPGEVYYIAVQNIRGQNYSTRQVYGPYTAPDLVSDDTTHIGGIATDLFVTRVIDVESLSAATATAVAALEDIYGDTASAAASAAEAALSEANAILAAAAADESADTASTQAGIATGAATAAGTSASAASTSAGAAASSASDSASSAAASQTSRLAAEAANTAAGTSASAAATSASAASGSASAAGSSASAANTFATNAATEAGNAATSATAASSSATTAAGHAATASTAATNAATSAGLASGSATAASGSASSAATSATAAGNSATAAAASQVAANASYIDTVLVGGNQHFDQGLTGWTFTAPGTGYTVLDYAGRTAIVLSSNTAIVGSSDKRFRISAGRDYELATSLFAGSGTGSFLSYFGLICYDAAGTNLGTAYPIYGHSAAALSGWHDIGPVAFTLADLFAGTAEAQLYAQINYVLDPVSVALDYFTIEDVTERTAADDAASAAATSASSAAASSSSAGSSATAASGSATTASTQAGLALTYAGQSSTSAAGSAASAVTAGTAATTATSAAATATTQASNASASAASAAASATLAATVGTSSLVSNSRFSDYPLTSGIPPAWSDWNAGGTGTRGTGEAGGYCYILAAGAGASAGILQNTAPGSAKDGDYVVIEADVYLASGALTGAGCYLLVFNAALSTYQTLDLTFSTTADSSGVMPGAGTTGQSYRFSKLVRVSKADASLYRLYALSHNSGLGSIAAANQIEWHKCSVRPATSAEIAAGVSLPALSSSVAATQLVVADLATNYALARYTLSATTPGGAAILALTSTTYGTVAGLSADQIYWGENTYFDNATDTVRTTTGTTLRVVAYGAAFGTDGTLLDWEGSSAVAFASMSRANAYHYTANAAPYAGGSRRLVRTDLVENEAITKEWRYDSQSVTSYTASGAMTTRVTMFSMTLTATGKKITFDGKYLLHARHSQDAWNLYVVVERLSGSTTTDVFTSKRGALAISGDGYISDWQHISFTDTPPSGTTVYTVRVYHDYTIGGPGGFVDYDVSNRILSAREHKTET